MHQILRSNVAGMPLEWISYQQAARLYCSGQVCYVIGRPLYHLGGGINAITRRRSKMTIHSIIATDNHPGNYLKFQTRSVPPLHNAPLFRRDGYLCMYCGHHYPTHLLSRDHVRPLSRGGQDIWPNVVTACKRCNNAKAGWMPEEVGMELLAVPFVPSHAEYIYLQGRRVLTDQMEYLMAHFPRTSPLHERLRDLK